MTTSLLLRFTAKCPSCHQPIHIQGLTETSLCASCQHAMALPVETWLSVFSLSDVLEVLEDAPGAMRSCTMMGSISCTSTLGRAPPACPKCQRLAPHDDLAALARVGQWTCTCGAAMRVRAADDLLRAVVPDAQWVLNEGATGATALEDRAETSPVHFGCMSCGGSLVVDGSTRTVTCQYCSGTNYLPDGLWLRLHPPTTVRNLYVIVAAGQGSELSPVLVERLAAATDADLRMGGDRRRRAAVRVPRGRRRPDRGGRGRGAVGDAHAALTGVQGSVTTTPRPSPSAVATVPSGHVTVMSSVEASSWPR